MMTDTIKCTIERRLLVNFRIDPDVLSPLLPEPFRPHVVAGSAIGGICFIRLGGIRSAHTPAVLGIATENVAHRFAVEWENERGTQVGVYIPQRFTNSRISSMAGGRIFPGQYGLARFHVQERPSDIHIDVRGRHESVAVTVDAHPTEQLGSTVFSSVNDAVAFFRAGALSYSPTGRSDCVDGVRLRCDSWDASPLEIDLVRSSFFDNETQFPRGSCQLDSGMIMRDLPARFISEGALRSEVLQEVG